MINAAGAFEGFLKTHIGKLAWTYLGGVRGISGNGGWLGNFIAGLVCVAKWGPEKFGFPCLPWWLISCRGGGLCIIGCGGCGFGIKCWGGRLLLIGCCKDIPCWATNDWGCGCCCVLEFPFSSFIRMSFRWTRCSNLRIFTCNI